MKLRVLVFGVAWTCCLYGQKKGFDFTEACFKNPALPYCPGRDFAPKPDPKGGKTSGVGRYGTAGETAPSTIDAAGIDWRFEAQNVFGALSGVNQVALSVRGDKLLLMVTGRPAESILPAPKAGWKAVPLGTSAVLMGNADAVDQASQRLTMDSALGDLPSAAQQRPGDSEFWTAGSAKLAGQEAVSAGVKRFESMASMRDGLASDTIFEFGAAPDPSAIKAWLSALGDAKMEGNAVLVRTTMGADETRRNVSQIGASPLGQRLGAIISSARYLPKRDTEATVHAHPVICGLDGGPREVK